MKNKNKIDKENASEAEIHLNDPSESQNSNFVVTHLGDRLVEFHPCGENYEEREWNYCSDVKELKSFLTKRKLEVTEGYKFLVCERNDQVVSITLMPAKEERLLNENTFKEQEDATSYIVTHKLRPTAGVAPKEANEEIRKFFAGEVCFFNGYEEIYARFIQEMSNISDEAEKMRTHTRYEHEVLDILLKVEEKLANS
jgi:hypothetical protein